MASFSIEGKGRWLKIVSPCTVISVATKKNSTTKSINSNSAQWDTGSMVTCISERLVKELGLIKTGVTTITGIENKPRRANTYIVDIRFPNDMFANCVEVVEAPMTLMDMLIGMDIISDCDFHYTKENGKSKINISYIY